MINQKISLNISFVINRILIVIILAAIFFLPSFLTWFTKLSDKSDIYLPLIITVYVSILPAIAALISLDRLLNNIKKNQVFIEINTLCLRIISWCCFLIGIIYSVFGYFYLMSLMISFAAVFFGIILRVLKNVFAKAVEIKNENDFTV